MQQYSGFTLLTLQNRLGQAVELEVCFRPTDVRDYVFVACLNQRASSMVGKNAQHFAVQLCELFAFEPRRFELIEVRDTGAEQTLWRWRFEWVGRSPMAPKGELIASATQQRLLLDLLNSDEALKLVATQ